MIGLGEMGAAIARVLLKSGYQATVWNRIKTHVKTVLPLAEVKKAHEISKGGRTRGKIVLQP